jgi:hypothetical protein
MLDAQYIGSLLVEAGSSKPKGEPSIEMVISADKDGNINAEAYDLDAGPDAKRHTLNVSLQDIDSLDELDNPPNFAFNSQTYNSKKTVHERKFPWLVLVIAALFAALAVVALWFFFLGGDDAFSTAEAEPEYSAPVYRQEPVREPQPLPPLPVYEPEPEREPLVIKAPAAPAKPRPAVKRVRPPAPVKSYRVPAVIPRNGVVYQIQWGDTLWDISAAFYRNPWLYPKIAKDNKIRNPDLIIAGSNLRIMPKPKN